MDVQTGVPQDSKLGLLFLFADNTLLFSAVIDPNTTVNQINNDLYKINEWPYQWKINFNSDTSKQAQKVIFSCKIKITVHPDLVFNNDLINETTIQKHFRMFVDYKLIFKNIYRICSMRLIKLQNYYEATKHSP